jgi:hypothetical protein
VARKSRRGLLLRLAEFRKHGKGSLASATSGFFFAAPSLIAPSACVRQLRLLALTTVNVDHFAIIDSALEDDVSLLSERFNDQGHYHQS